MINDSKGEGFLEEDFNRISQTIIDFYQPIFLEKGDILSLNLDWDNPRVNASTGKWGNFATVYLYGGLARHKFMTPNGFALVICHEIGHHLGGEPRYKKYSWASVEGQSDYYASLKCFKNYLDNCPECHIPDTTGLDITLVSECSKSGEDFSVCVSTAMAGMSIAQTIAASRVLPKPLGFGTPSDKIVKKTYERHPHPQCRLDTYFAGALCDKDVATPDLCSRKNGDSAISSRPLCWFKPKKK